MYQEDTILLKSLKGRPVKGELTIDARMRMNDSESFEWYRLVLKPSEKTNTYIGCARNINETKKKEEQLKLKAHIDPLSKVLNRETAIEKIRERLKTQKMNEECAFIVLDIDNFKNYLYAALSRFGPTNKLTVHGLKQIIHPIYFIRCNLFHGAETPNLFEHRKQKERFVIYAAILAGINQMLFYIISKSLGQSHK